MQHQTYTLFKFSNQELYWPIKIIGNQMLLSCTCSTSLLQCQTRMHTPSPRELTLRVLCKILETFGVVIYKRYQLQGRKVIREQHYCSPWAKSSGAHYSVFLKKKTWYGYRKYWLTKTWNIIEKNYSKSNAFFVVWPLKKAFNFGSTGLCCSSLACVVKMASYRVNK